MKIAVTYADGLIYQHFGHTPAFKIYEVEASMVLAARIVQTDGSGHSALADFLRQQDVDVLICGGLGGCAKDALAQSGIRLFGGVSGDADDAVEALLMGDLDYDPCAHCDHHDHSCGTHSCGDSDCRG